MPTTIHEVFGIRTLMRAVPEIYGNTQADTYFQDLFMEQGSAQTVAEVEGKGDYVSWDEVTMPKTAAPFTTRDGGYVEDKKTSRKHRMIVMAHIKLKKHFSSSRIYASRGDGTLRDNVPQQVNKEFRAMLKKILRSKEILASMVLKGGGTFNSSVIEGMEVTFTITFSGLATFTPSASWATPSTKLLSDDFDRVRAAFYTNCREELGRMIVDAKVRNYLVANTELQGYFQSGSALAALALGEKPTSGPVLNDFELDGLMWHATRAGYDASEGAGSPTKYLGDDLIIGLPQDLSEVLGFAEGHGDIPVNAFGQDASMLLTKARNPGLYAFAMPGTANDDDPAGATLFVGWKGMFVLLNPYAVLKDGVLS